MLAGPDSFPGADRQRCRRCCRCLIKNLESLRVHYDGTVRDNCDGSVVQVRTGCL